MSQKEYNIKSTTDNWTKIKYLKTIRKRLIKNAKLV
jgi:hypothetical protein